MHLCCKKCFLRLKSLNLCYSYKFESCYPYKVYSTRCIHKCSYLFIWISSPVHHKSFSKGLKQGKLSKFSYIVQWIFLIGSSTSLGHKTLERIFILDSCLQRIGKGVCGFSQWIAPFKDPPVSRNQTTLVGVGSCRMAPFEDDWNVAVEHQKCGSLWILCCFMDVVTHIWT